MPEPRTAVKKSRNPSQSPGEQPAAGTVNRCLDIDLDEILSCAVDLACDILGTDTASIALADKEGTLAFRSQRGLSPECARRWRGTSTEGLTSIVFRTGQFYAYPDLQADAHYSGSAMEREGIRALLVLPLKSGDEVIGCLYIGHRTPHDFSPDEVRLASLLADHVSMSVRSTTFFQQERRQRQRSEALVDVLTATASTLSMKEVLIKLCKAVVNISVADRCSIFIVDEESRTLRPVMSLGIEDGDLWRSFRNPSPGENTTVLPENRRLFETITKWEDPIVIEDAEATTLLSRWWVDTFNLKSLVQYPLRVKDRTIGLMTVDAFRQRVRFPKEEVDTLAAVAKQAAVIIENAHLYEQERQQRQRAEALVNVLSAAASDVSFRKVLATISQAVVDFSVGERCSIFLLNEETRSLDPVMAMGPGDPSLFEEFRASAGLKISSIRGIDEAIKAQEPVIEEHAPGSAAVPGYWTSAFRLKSVAIYPLVHREKTVGIIVVNTFSHFTHFPQDEIETLAAVAKQAAIIIEYARLHEQLQEQAITDYITGLFNHRHIHLRLEEEFARAARNNSPFAVMMMDVDKFKEFNDTYGHVQGDEALRFIAGRLRETLRTVDIIGRYGGDEFLAVLPDTTREDAEEAGRRLVSMLAGTPFSPEDGQRSVSLAMSIGIACYPQDSSTKDQLVTFADAALYAAKRLGGNRAVPASGATLRRAPSPKKISA